MFPLKSCVWREGGGIGGCRCTLSVYIASLPFGGYFYSLLTFTSGEIVCCACRLVCSSFEVVYVISNLMSGVTYACFPKYKPSQI